MERVDVNPLDPLFGSEPGSCLHVLVGSVRFRNKGERNARRHCCHNALCVGEDELVAHSRPTPMLGIVHVLQVKKHEVREGKYRFDGLFGRIARCIEHCRDACALAPFEQLAGKPG